MYVCICSAVTERQISQAVQNGADTLKALRSSLGVCGACCKCAGDIRELIGKSLGSGGGRPVESGFPISLGASAEAGSVGRGAVATFATGG